MSKSELAVLVAELEERVSFLESDNADLEERICLLEQTLDRGFRVVRD